MISRNARLYGVGLQTLKLTALAVAVTPQMSVFGIHTIASLVSAPLAAMVTISTAGVNIVQ